MSLVFAAITPHPPMLIPDIGKEQLDKIEKTKLAMDKLEEELYIAKPQIIIIISPHSGLFENSFSVNAHPDFISSFEEFGDLSTKKEWTGAPNLAAEINQLARHEGISVHCVSKENLDHGVAVPLFYLTRHLENCKILPIGYSHMDAKDHIEFGKMLKECILNLNKRVAIIASGDLSHDIDKKIFNRGNLDKKLIKIIKNKEISKLIQLEDTKELLEANTCGYRSLLIIMGILSGLKYDFIMHSYEHPFGVGYLTGNFSF